MIIDNGGRASSIQTREELEALLRGDFEQMTTEDQEVLLELLEIMGEGKAAAPALEAIQAADYKREVVDVETFVTHKYFLGETCKDLYPVLMADLKEIFSGDYNEIIYTGSIGLDSIIQEADGGLPTLRERLGKHGPVTVMLDNEQGTSPTEPAHNSGIKPVMRLTLKNGMQLDLTPDHEVRVWRGTDYAWVPAEKLTTDDFVVTPRLIHTEPSSDVPPERAADIAREDIESGADHIRDVVCRASLESVQAYLSVVLSQAIVPRPTIGRLGNWSKDSIYQCKYSYRHDSERFIRQLQLLLLRFGIRATVRFHPKYEPKRCSRAYWEIEINGIADDIFKCLRLFGVSDRSDRDRESSELLLQHAANPERRVKSSLLPFTYGDAQQLLKKGGAKMRKPWPFARKPRVEERVSRHALDKLYTSVKGAKRRLLDEMVAKIYDEVGFEQVVSIERRELSITVGDIGAHNGNRFIANGLSVHNSIGFGKCVDGDTEVFDVATGKRCRVRDLSALRVQSFSSEGQSRVSDATAFPSGEKPCVTMTLMSGQTLTLSTDHPVLTGRGWVHAEDVSLSDLVATPRSLPEPEKALDVPDDEVVVVGYLLADGGCTGPSPTFTNMTPSVLREYADCTDRLAQSNRMYDSAESSSVPVKNPNAGRAMTYRTRGVQWFVDKYDLRHTSREKRIPAEFYGLTERQIGLLLNRIWACDGSLNMHSRVAEIGLASELMIRDIQFLLLRLGVNARYAKCRKTYTHKGEKRSATAYRLHVSGRENMLRFLDVVGDIIGKEDKCWAMRDRCLAVDNTRESTNTDVVPIDKERLYEVFREVERRGVKVRSKYQLGGRHCSRSRFQRLVEESRYDGEWSWYADSDLLWQRVRNIEDAGTREVFDLSVPGDHNFVANGVVIHNTFACSIGVCYVLYQLSCMHKPAATFNLAPETPITVLGLSASEDLAKEVVLKNVIGKIAQSKYFSQNFRPRITQRNIRFPNGVTMWARATTPRSALGMNPVCALVDEIDFMPKRRKKSQQRFGVVNMSKEIYDSITRRIKSRFGRYGKLFLPCSKSTNDSFLSRRLKEAENDPNVFVRDYALWNAKPGDYSKKKFWVLCGNEQVPSRILPDEEVESIQEDQPERTTLLEIPLDFRGEFESDLEGSIRDLGGVSTVTFSPFIQRRHKVYEMEDEDRKHPFSKWRYEIGKPGHFLWDELTTEIAGLDADGRVVYTRKPKLHPEAPRHAHFDPALNQCSAGLCITHQYGMTHVRRRNKEMALYDEEAPLFFVDLILEIVPPVGGELEFAMYRQLVYDFVEHGYPIVSVSMDGFQSVDALQILSDRGYHTSRISLDKTWDPYQHAKSALYENRVKCYYHPELFRQLQKLEADWEKRKVLAPEGELKDVADSFAGSLWGSYHMPAYFPLPLLVGNSSFKVPLGKTQETEGRQRVVPAIPGVSIEAQIANNDYVNQTSTDNPVMNFFRSRGLW